MSHHLSRIARTLLACSLLAALSSCDRTVEVPVTVETDAEEWTALTEAHPLPEDLAATVVFAPMPAAVSADSDAPRPVLRLWRTVEPAVTRASDDERSLKTLELSWLAPAAPIWEPTAQPDILPLDRIDVPFAALAADGLYPDDAAYPLVEQLLLEFDADATGLDPDDDRRLALEAWFEAITDADGSPPAITWIAGVGDLMVERGVTELLDRSDGLELVFGDVLPLMQAADVLLGNLEGAVSRRGTPLEKTFTFRFHPRVLDPLARAGFDYLSIVNNHSYDYGETAFLDSLDHLAAAGIATSGAGRSLAEARLPYRFAGERAGVPIHVLSVGAYPVERSGFDGARQTAATADAPGVLWAGPRNPAAQAEAIAAMNDAFGEESFDIVMVHGGPEWATRPPQWQRELYRSFVDAGADLVLGHHSHVVQATSSSRGCTSPTTARRACCYA